MVKVRIRFLLKGEEKIDIVLANTEKFLEEFNQRWPNAEILEVEVLERKSL